MVGFTGIRAVYLYPGAVDMRKGVRSLATIVSEMATPSQRRGSAFVFLGLTGKSMKVVLFDERGSWLIQRKLSGCAFRLPEEGSELILERGALEAIVDALTVAPRSAERKGRTTEKVR